MILLQNIIDILFLLVALYGMYYVSLKKRSRIGIIAIMVASLAYFGFYRKGCTCSIGALQNIIVAFTNKEYSISIVTVAFFFLPILFTLYCGRVFCAGVCPIGALQDLFLIRSLSIPLSIQNFLKFVPALFLLIAVLSVVLNHRFLICEFDPFVSIFRLDGPSLLINLSIIGLVISTFIARPYCRFFCPYGFILNIVSRFSKNHVSITPDQCIQCGLCRESCPVGAISISTKSYEPDTISKGYRRFLIYLFLSPLWIALFGIAGYNFIDTTSISEQINELKNVQVPPTDSTNLTEKEIVTASPSIEQQRANLIKKENYSKYYGLSGGILLGLMIAFSLVCSALRNKNKDYSPRRGYCISCGRCFNFCPFHQHYPKKQP